MYNQADKPSNNSEKEDKSDKLNTVFTTSFENGFRAADHGMAVW